METPVIATSVSAATETAVSAEAEETPARGTAVLAAVLNAISAAAQETLVFYKSLGVDLQAFAGSLKMQSHARLIICSCLANDNAIELIQYMKYYSEIFKNVNILCTFSL